MCPISRRAFKEKIQYLSEADVQRLRDELIVQGPGIVGAALGLHHR
jgi:hypothetical protein